MSISFEGALDLEGPGGTAACLKGEGRVATLEVRNLTAAKELLRSSVVRHWALQGAEYLEFLKRQDLEFRVKVGKRTVFSTDKGGRAAAVLARILKDL